MPEGGEGDGAPWGLGGSVCRRGHVSSGRSLLLLWGRGLEGEETEEGPQRQLREVNARKVLERPWPGLCDQVHGGMGRERSGS